MTRNDYPATTAYAVLVLAIALIVGGILSVLTGLVLIFVASGLLARILHDRHHWHRHE